MNSNNLRETGQEDRDRITYLHDDVLAEILSRLPIKDAVRTTILSKAWEYKWTSSYNVDLDDKSTNGGDLKARMFANFVNMILFSCVRVKQFRLKCRNSYDLERAQTWISAALRHKLESFEVSCNLAGIVYPCALVNSVALRKLDISATSKCTLNVSALNVAANLTRLSLYKVRIVNRNPNPSTMAFSFPVLETFKVRWCGWREVESVEIDAPLLTTFASATYSPRPRKYSFLISAPRLATFESHSVDFPENYILNGGSSVVSAIFSYVSDVNDHHKLALSGIQVNKLLNQLKTLEFLQIPCRLVEFGHSRCCYENLTRLALLGNVKPGNLCHMLHAAPSLKLLKVESVDDDCNWEIERVPSCIVSRLEEVFISGGYPIQSQNNMVKFLLKNGERLEKISLGGSAEVKVSSARLKAISSLYGLPPRSSRVIIE